MAGGIAVGGEDRGAVAKLGGVDDLDGFLVGVGVHDDQDRPEDLFAINAQVAIHAIDDGGGQPEAVRVFLTLGAVAAAVEDDVRTLRLGLVDPLGNALLGGAGDDRAHLGGRVGAGADNDLLSASLDRGHELLLDATNGDDHGQGHAALAGRAECAGADVLRGELDVRIGHDDRMVVRTTQGLDALAMGHARVLHDVGDRGGTNEGDRVDAGVGEDVGDQVAVTGDDVEQAVGQASLLVEAGDDQRGAGDDRGDLEDEGVAGGQGDRVHPHGDHGREVEGADAGDDADGLTQGVHVHAGRGLVGELTLEGSVDATRKVDGLTATSDLAEGVAVGLAALTYDGVGDLILMLDDELTELEHDVHALGQGGAAPFLLRVAGDLDDLVEAMLVGESELVDDLAGGRVFDADGLLGVSDILFAVDPQIDCHWFYLSSHSSANGETTLLGQIVARS